MTNEGKGFSDPEGWAPEAADTIIAACGAEVESVAVIYEDLRPGSGVTVDEAQLDSHRPVEQNPWGCDTDKRLVVDIDSIIRTNPGMKEI